MGKVAQALAAVGVALAAGCGSEPSTGDDAGRFVFAAEDERAGSLQVLHTAEADGTDVESVIRDASAEVHSDPEWSPDGTRIAFDRATPCPQRNDPIDSHCHAIWTVNVDGTEAQRVVGPSVDVNYLSPTWSPDGKRLAYVHSALEPEAEDLYVIDASGEQPRRLTTELSVYDPAWSPDGDDIVFSAYGPGGYFPGSDLYVVGVDDGQVRRLTHTPSSGEDHPSWAPDGNRIAYERLIPRRAIVYQVWVMNSDGTEQKRVSEPAADFDLSPVWAADGDQLAYWSDRDETDAIWVVSVDRKGSPQKIVDGLSDPAFDWNVPGPILDWTVQPGD